ncbi:2-oxo acid dehydrogenase subunit E2 [bacterium]|nr:2-oxo acid dehydrogenase subunit E2 [bacterium]
MAEPIYMPKFGQMTEDSAIVEWRKNEGDPVAKGDVLFTVETDKSVMEVEAFADGTLLKIVIPPGASVPVQTTVGFIGKPGEPIPAVQPPPAPAPEAQAAPQAAGAPIAAARREARPPTAPAAAVAAPAAQPALPAAPARFRISPRARQLAKDCVIDPRPVRGSGPAGRVTEKDVRAHLAARGYDRRRPTPAAKQLAAREGIDLLTVELAAPDARVEVADVARAIAEKPKPMSRMRQVIAQRLTQSFTGTPHIFVTVTVDMTDLIAYRTQLKAQGAPYTVTDFIAQAVVLALVEFPDVNSSTDGRSTRWHSHVNLGIAVSLEQGLVVPVVRQAETLNLPDLCRRAKQLVEKARAGKAGPDDLTGSTFTISNMGMLDVENFCAIINPGESAILAVSSTVPQAVVRNGQIVPRSMMKMTLSADHRLVDGALAARFANAIKHKLEDVELWKRLAA